MNPKIELTPTNRKFIIENFLKMNNQEIGKELNVSHTTVYNWTKKLKLGKRKTVRIDRPNDNSQVTFFCWDKVKEQDFIFNN